MPRLFQAIARAALLSAVGVAASHAQTPADTGWTYQGRLTDNATPANGPYDMRFTLFIDDQGTLQNGPILDAPGIDVSDGLFTTKLDFGALFTGNKNWLLVEVSPAGAGTYTPLPLQEITSAPQSLLSLRPWNTDSALNISYSDGNVGIGTSSPATKLHVSSDLSVSSLIETTGGTNSWARTEYKTPNGKWDVGTSQNFNGDQFSIYREGASSIAFVVQPNGTVGIGASTPLAKLHVYDPLSVTSRVETGGGTNSWARSMYRTVNGSWELGTSRGFNGDQFYLFRTGAASTAFVVQPSGEVGVGATTPLAKFHLYDPQSVTSLVETGGGTNSWAKSVYKNLNGGWEVGTSRGFNGDQFYIYRSGAATVALAVNPNGLTQVRTLQILGGSDLAEPFNITADAGAGPTLPGMVVVIDESNPGDLRLADRPYDTRVAGVISGANGLEPGMVMKAMGHEKADGEHPVAMTGRVWCYVDASFGAVRPGDRLTTSSTPGHAMKADEAARCGGAVIGKAMTGLPEGKGLVLVLVNLQ